MHIHCGHRPGAIGAITQLHATFYAAHSGFGVAFEAQVATGLADFCLRLDPQRDGLWLAMEGDAILGSIAIDGAAAGTATDNTADNAANTAGAHLRWFIMADRLRGTGAGRQLLQAALAFCDARQYASVYLWTFDQLHAARHLYEQHGFRLDQTQVGRQWGTEVNEQKFVRRR